MANVERVVTVFTEVELAEALILGHKEVFGATPSRRMVVNAWSQCALECGRDGKGNISKCRNYNLGNITITTAQAKSGRDYWSLRCQEQLRDKNGKLTGEWRWFDMRFAANPTLLDGAIHYWTFFSAKKRKIALDAMREGGPKEFTDALAAIWYMTANPDHYLKGLNRLATVADASTKEAFKALEAPKPATPVESTDEGSSEPEDADDESSTPDTPSMPHNDDLGPADTPEELFWPEPPKPSPPPMLIPDVHTRDEDERPSGMVPVVHLNQTPWDRFILWLVAWLSHLLCIGRKPDDSV